MDRLQEWWIVAKKASDAFSHSLQNRWNVLKLAGDD